MGLFKLIHDIMGIDGRKASSLVKGSRRAIKHQRDKLRNCERVKKIRT